MLASCVQHPTGQEGLGPEAEPTPLDIVLAGSDPASAQHKLLMLLLRKWGHHVTVDAGADTAHADLVLLDLDACGLAGLPRWAGHTARRAGLVTDREAWLRAHGASPGLDEVLAKPLNPQALRAVVQAAVAARAQPALAGPDAAPSGFDYGLALAQADAWIVGVIGEDFIQSWPGQLAALREACARDDVPAMQRAAHTLRGLAANFNAEPVCRLARAFEQSGGLARAAGQFGPWQAELAQELAALNAALVAFCQPGAKH